MALPQILFGCFTGRAYLGVDGNIAVLGQARVLVESPELLQCIQVSILKVLQSSLVFQQVKTAKPLGCILLLPWYASLHVTAC